MLDIMMGLVRSFMYSTAYANEDILNLAILPTVLQSETNSFHLGCMRGVHVVERPKAGRYISMRDQRKDQDHDFPGKSSIISKTFFLGSKSRAALLGSLGVFCISPNFQSRRSESQLRQNDGSESILRDGGDSGKSEVHLKAYECPTNMILGRCRDWDMSSFVN